MVVKSWVPENVTNPVVFNRQLGILMNNLESNASLKASKFEVGSIKYNDFSSIYGMVQCTQDLSSFSCTSCLQDMISRIPGYLNGLRGHIFTKSCFLRYYDHLFYELVPPPPSPSPATVPGSLPPPSDSDKEPPPGPKSSLKIVAVAVPVVLGVILLILVVCLYFLRRTKMVTTARDPTETQDSLQFDLVIIRNATNEFSDANKLGEGGFGAVYKVSIGFH
ncbi:hypothetical protein MKX03_031280 [Papaver bracteatum]|nr:hypothetical protein MKX03_031280 [Papaver bracteatum]